jgi:hypothetical protein
VTALREPQPRTMTPARPAPGRSVLVDRLAWVLAALAVTAASAGLLVDGGPGRIVARTARNASVVLYGDGLYAADTWLIGAGNRGQDVVILLLEVPALLLVLRWYRRGGRVAAAVLTGVLAFFTYLYTSMMFATAQNRLFPVYVAAAAVAGFALVLVASALDGVAEALPPKPGRGALAAYLLAVAGALTLAWLPETLLIAATGHIAEAVGPYTSQATHALDLGLVVPVALIAAVQLLRRRASGHVLALVLLVLNVCIGCLLIAQGIAQLVSGVPMTGAEIFAKMLSFAVLTVVAGGLLTRMARASGSTAAPSERKYR